jgi:hypothetical protein
MEKYITANLDNLRDMELVKRFSSMEATMKANGLKIKNQEKSVKNLIIIKISCT